MESEIFNRKSLPYFCFKITHKFADFLIKLKITAGLVLYLFDILSDIMLNIKLWNNCHYNYVLYFMFVLGRYIKIVSIKMSKVTIFGYKHFK